MLKGAHALTVPNSVPYVRSTQLPTFPALPTIIVETRMRPLAVALIATLGAKAPSDWNYVKTFRTTYYMDMSRELLYPHTSTGRTLLLLLSF